MIAWFVIPVLYVTVMRFAAQDILFTERVDINSVYHFFILLISANGMNGMSSLIYLSLSVCLSVCFSFSPE